MKGTSAGHEVHERGLLGTGLLLLGSAAVALGLCFGYAFLVEPMIQQALAPDPPPADPTRQMATPWIVPGLDRPPTVPAAAADLDPNAEVIGVVTAAGARAYWLEALSGPQNHVLNDVLGKVPVTVTYCDRTECIRVFTGVEDGKPLGFWLGGWDGQNMLLRFRGGFYLQHTGQSGLPDVAPLPCPILPAERTTWQAWRAAHPDTDVFVGAHAAQTRPAAERGADGEELRCP